MYLVAQLDLGNQESKQKVKTIAAYDFKCIFEEINRKTQKNKGRDAKKKGIYETRTKIVP